MAKRKRVQAIVAGDRKRKSWAKAGGVARAASLTKRERSEIARTAALARWKKKGAA